jgi:predicted RecA/RadA family phage recombinase
MAYTGQPVPSTVNPILRAKISDGKSVIVTVPEKTKVEAQTFVLLDGFFGIAMETIETGEGETAELALSIEQAEYETDQITTSDTYKVGDLVYFKASTKKLTTNAGTEEAPNRLVGRVTSEKDANNVIWFILLPQQG